MRTLAVLLLLLPFSLQAQKVFITKNKVEAKLIVYKASTQIEADTTVRTTSLKSKASQGYWYFTNTRSEADKVIYITNIKAEANRIIYFKPE
jgi:competence protein ComGC